MLEHTPLRAEIPPDKGRFLSQVEQTKPLPDLQAKVDRLRRLEAAAYPSTIECCACGGQAEVQARPGAAAALSCLGFSEELLAKYVLRFEGNI